MPGMPAWPQAARFAPGAVGDAGSMPVPTIAPAGDVAGAGRGPRPRGAAQYAVAACVVVLAAGAVVLAGTRPLWAFAGALGCALVALAAGRLQVGVALLVASFYFDAYLDVGAGIVTAGKLLGVLALLAWFLSWAFTGRAVVSDGLFWPLAGFAAWLPLSLVAAYDLAEGATVALRYVTFFVLVFLVVQAVAGERRAALRLVDVSVAAAAVAAVIGLVVFLTQGDRARGPLDDPNDYAFMLAVTVPLVLYRTRWAGSRALRSLAVVALLLLLAAILATLSRSALVGLAAAGVWAVATGRLRLRWAVLAVGCALAVGLAWYLLEPQLVETAVLQKQHIAQANVERRLVAWQVALREVGSSPLFGVGPGNFESRFDEFSLPPLGENGALAAHNAYLSVLGELGIPGFALFGWWLWLSWSRLRRRAPGDPEGDALQGALAGGFVVAAVGALFLTEQFYSPLWLLPAIGATLLRGPPGGARDGGDGRDDGDDRDVAGEDEPAVSAA
jgi:O-antigen ligase